jgi:hypothetical protein
VNRVNIYTNIPPFTFTNSTATTSTSCFYRAVLAKLLNCTTEDVAILVTAGKLRALGKPRPNAVKFFSSIELITLVADANWLDDVTKIIVQHWRRKNAQRNGLTASSKPSLIC